MIHQDFDLTGITRFVLGLYWRVVSPAERRQFRKGPKGGVWLAKRDRLIAERADKRGAVAPRNDQDLARPVLLLVPPQRSSLRHEPIIAAVDPIGAVEDSDLARRSPALSDDTGR